MRNNTQLTYGVMARRRHTEPNTNPLALEALEPRSMLAATCCQSDPMRPAETTSNAAADDLEFVSTAAIAATASRTSGDAGESFASAADVGVLGERQSHQGFVGRGDRLDVVRFSLRDDARVVLTLDQLRGDVDIYLYNDRGRLIESSKQASAAPEQITTSLSEGDYFLVMAPYTWSGSTYRLGLEASYFADTSASESNRFPTDAFPNVAYFGGVNDWNVNAINAPEAWAEGFTGQGVTVAVVDTGVDLQHPDLVDNLWTNPGEIPGNRLDDDGNGFIDDVYGWDFVDGDANPDDRNGHGTHVAGTISAALNGFGATGIAPDATIMPVRVLGSDGSGSTFSVAAGIRYAAENGADIINLSLGGGFSNAILSAIDDARQLGTLVVAAAGNEGAATPGYPARFSAALSNVISVGAYSSTGTLAGFSNDVGTSRAVQVDAPGVGIFSTFSDNRFARLSGTSMAAPHVAGLAALALSAQPGLTPAELRALIVEGATQAIRGADSNGGVNAAVTVARAAAGAGRHVQKASRMTVSTSATPTARPSITSSRGVSSSRRVELSRQALALDALNDEGSVNERLRTVPTDTLHAGTDERVNRVARPKSLHVDTAITELFS